MLINVMVSLFGINDVTCSAKKLTWPSLDVVSRDDHSFPIAALSFSPTINSVRGVMAWR